MKVVYFPDRKDSKGPVIRFLEKLKKERPELWTLVDQTLKKVERSSSLDDLIRQRWVGHLKKIKAPIFEFRIPPRKQGGVIRLYFAYKENDSSTIVILSAERKQGKNEANKDDIKSAEKRYKEVCT